MTARAAIAVGSNMGDRMATIRAALAALETVDGCSVEAVSEMIETDPVGPVLQDRYLNGAAVVSTDLRPRELLEACLRIERKHGRDRAATAERWGPRPLDLDLLLYGAEIVDEPGLVVPHPRMGERIFVLEPLASIAGEWAHPVTGLTVANMLRAAIERNAGEQACE
ncbi:MAG: 2-amino-4-hydroxy-6-hydroxymethyldihydropteridine diphosphokinase [Planctomycetota bacterium]